MHRSEQGSESRVNEEFVEWLKTKGPTWLLVVLLALAAYLGYVRWTEGREARQAQAWIELQEALNSGLPSSFESVAEQYGEINSVGLYARLQAGRVLMESVQRGVPVGVAMDEEEGVTLSDSERENYLDRAQRLYREVLDTARNDRGRTIFIVKARNGLAAVAEARGNLDEARSQYEQAATAAEADYAHLARQARMRAENLDQVEVAVSLPSAEELEARSGLDQTEREPVAVDRAFRDLLLNRGG